MRIRRLVGLVAASTAAITLTTGLTGTAHANTQAAPSKSRLAPAAGAPVAVNTSASTTDVQQRAKGGCSWAGCSEIQNRANYRVWVARDWCGKPDTGGVCGNSPKQRLWPGEHSYEDAYEDTDAFAVGAGCVMKVQWNEDGDEHDPIETINRKGKSTKYYKVSDTHDIDIEDYDC